MKWPVCLHAFVCQRQKRIVWYCDCDCYPKTRTYSSERYRRIHIIYQMPFQSYRQLRREHFNLYNITVNAVGGLLVESAELAYARAGNAVDFFFHLTCLRTLLTL